MLEQADLEHENNHLRKSLNTFAVVGGGFSGVETVGELNHFVRDSIKEFYHNIDESKDVRIILVNAQDKILPEVSEDLAEFALQKLRQSGVEVILSSSVTAATADTVKLNDGTIVPCHTLVWTGGVRPEQLILNLKCDHDKNGRIIVNNYLKVHKYRGVYAIGDCASIIDPHTGKPYPPTAQHAIREGRVAARNLIFDGDLLGLRVHGFVAWWLWRSYYLSNLPTIQKKLRVMVDWSIDLFFKHDVTRIRTFTEEKGLKKEKRSYDKKIQ
jgi:NADH dehydrogenase